MTQLMCKALGSWRSVMHIYTQNNHACETIPSHSKIPVPAAKSSAKFLLTTNTRLRPPTRKYGPHNKIPCKALTGTFICFNNNPISIHIALDFIEGDKRGIFYEKYVAVCMLCRANFLARHNPSTVRLTPKMSQPPSTLMRKSKTYWPYRVRSW